MFSVNSTSVETKRVARVIRVLQRHLLKAKHVTAAAVYSCKDTAGTSLKSAHSFGDAVDLMIPVADAAGRKQVAEAIVRDGLKRTVFNLFRRTEVYFVIYDEKQWVRGEGWKAYTGVPHTNHVHAAGSGSVDTSLPCGAHLPGVAYVKA